MADKKADLAGPGIGNYDDLKRELPDGYDPLLSPKETMQALFAIKNEIEENLCKELSLQMVQVPLIVDKESGGSIHSQRLARQEIRLDDDGCLPRVETLVEGICVAVFIGETRFI